jgi:hypothetical protein
MPHNHLQPKNRFLQCFPTNGWCVKVAATPIPATTCEDSSEIDIRVVIAKIPRLAATIHDASMSLAMVARALSPSRENPDVTKPFRQRKTHSRRFASIRGRFRSQNWKNAILMNNSDEYRLQSKPARLLCEKE